jgi:hypothetical protein
VAEPKPSPPRARRIAVSFSADFSGRQVEGRGTVRNISLSGALIEEASHLLIAGGDVELRFAFFEGSLPVALHAEVVRETPTGFAVRFVRVDPRVREILRTAIARAAAERAA